MKKKIIDVDNRIAIQKFGKKEKEQIYQHKNINFAGDCVYTTQRHFIDCLINETEFETNGPEYLKSLKVQEACYESADTDQKVLV